MRLASYSLSMLILSSSLAFAEDPNEPIPDPEPADAPMTTQEGEVIEITGRAPQSPAGAVVINREDIAHTPGARGDALSAIKSLPGIANNGSLTPFSAGVIIRGSSPKDSKIFVDGFEIPILYHFLGLQSVFASEMIEAIDVKPGGFGVEQGRASAGTVSVTSRPGARTYASSVELSFLNVAAFAEGPLGKKASFAIGLRRSVIDAIIPLALPDDSSVSFTTLPRYYDAQARVDFEVDQRWNLSLLVFGADDSAKLLSDNANETDPTASGQFSDRERFMRAIASATYQSDSDDVRVRLAVSSYWRQNRFEIGTERHLRIDIGSLAARVSSSIRLNPKLTLTAGAESELLHTDVDIFFARPPREGDGGNPNFSVDSILDVVDTRDFANIAAWTALTATPVSTVLVRGGVRFDGHTRPGEYLLQPRGDVRVAVAERTKLLGSAGLYTRPPDDLDENAQSNLDVERAIQFTGGVEQLLFPGARLQASAFYTDRSDLVVFKTDRMSADPDDAYDNSGEGRSYGGEILLQYYDRRTTAWLAYTLSKSERLDRMTGNMRPFDFDQTHNLTVLYSRALGAKQQWRIGGRFQLTTGSPYTPVTDATYLSDLDVYAPTYGAPNSERLETQHQLDLRVDRIWKFQGWKLSAFLDVSNVYVNAAVIDYRYNFDYTERTDFTTLPIIPSLGVRGEF